MVDNVPKENSENYKEKRRAVRIGLPIKVRYQVSGREADVKGAITKDVSAGGCLLLVAEDLPLNVPIEIELFLGVSAKEAIKLMGRATRLNKSQHGIYEFGFVFDGFNKDTYRIFSNYIFDRMYEMVGLNAWPTGKKR